MRNLTLLSLGLALSLLLPCSASERIFVFGDSLSDNGNSFALAQLPPPPYGYTFNETGAVTGYFPGRFTDGPNWVDYLPRIAALFGVDLAPITAAYDPKNPNGTNFAVGGSTSGTTNVASQTLPSFPGQIGDYLARFKGKGSADDLFIIWIGSNDLTVGTSPAQTVANIKDGIARLAQAGARNFVVIDIPDLGLTPRAKALGGPAISAATQFALTTNFLLWVELPQLASLSRINIQVVDINTAFVPVVLQPGLFGFKDSVTPALTALAVNPQTDPNAYVFWDDFHPTTRVHQIAAGYIYATALFRGQSFLSFRQ